VKKLWLVSLTIFGCGGFGLWMVYSVLQSRPVSSEATPTPVVSPSPDVPHYQRFALPNSEIHVVRIPANSRFVVSVASAGDATESIETFATSNSAIAVLNAGFFDPKNQKTMSYVVQNGERIADPKQNERLTQNPNLQPYLTQILNRSEFRRYQCGENVQYAIVPHEATIPPNCKFVDSVGGGPQLLPKMTATEEGFVDPMVGRDSIGIRQRNARSAIGITGDGSLVLVMAAQMADAKDSGMSLPALATFMEQRLDVKQAMNLDGGSSSALFYQGKLFYGKVDKDGQPMARSVKSVVLVRE
jgi:hypothetical protein